MNYTQEEVEKVIEIIRKINDNFELPFGTETNKVVYKAIGKSLKEIVTEEEWEILFKVINDYDEEKR